MVSTEGVYFGAVYSSQGFCLLILMESVCTDCIILWRFGDVCVNTCCLCEQKPWAEPSLSHRATLNFITKWTRVCSTGIMVGLGHSWKCVAVNVLETPKFFISMCVKKTKILFLELNLEDQNILVFVLLRPCHRQFTLFFFSTSFLTESQNNSPP